MELWKGKLCFRPADQLFHQGKGRRQNRPRRSDLRRAVKKNERDAPHASLPSVLLRGCELLWRPVPVRGGWYLSVWGIWKRNVPRQRVVRLVASPKATPPPLSIRRTTSIEFRTNLIHPPR